MNIESAIKTSAPVTFRSWDDENLSATLTNVTHSHENERHYFTITLLIPPTTMIQIFNEQWFHLNSIVTLNDVSFESEGAIELLLALSPAITAKLVSKGVNAETIFKAILQNSSMNLPSLTSSEYWFLVEASQSISFCHLDNEETIRQGFHTIWRQDILHLPLQTSYSSANGHPLDEDALFMQTNLIEQTKQQLINHSLHYQLHNEQLIRMKVQSEHDVSWTELIRIEEEAALIIFYAIFPLSIPAEIRAEVAKVLMNDNYDLLNGAFEMDSLDGELRFRSTLLCPNGIDANGFHQLLMDHEQIMEHYIPVLRELLET